jgi:hypothetical protein
VRKLAYDVFEIYGSDPLIDVATALEKAARSAAALLIYIYTHIPSLQYIITQCHKSALDMGS